MTHLTDNDHNAPTVARVSLRPRVRVWLVSRAMERADTDRASSASYCEWIADEPDDEQAAMWIRYAVESTQAADVSIAAAVAWMVT